MANLRIIRTGTVNYEVDVAEYDGTPEDARKYELELEGNDLLEQFVDAISDPENEPAFSVEVYIIDDEPQPEWNPGWPPQGS